MFPQQNQAAAQDHPDSFSTNEYKYIEHYDHFKRDTDEKLCRHPQINPTFMRVA